MVSAYCFRSCVSTLSMWCEALRRPGQSIVARFSGASETRTRDLLGAIHYRSVPDRGSFPCK
jgi:hypothetical protein